MSIYVLREQETGKRAIWDASDDFDPRFFTVPDGHFLEIDGEVYTRPTIKETIESIENRWVEIMQSMMDQDEDISYLRWRHE